MFEDYEIEGEKYLQKLLDGWLGVASYDPLKPLWDDPLSESLWEEPDFWEDPQPLVSKETETQDIAIGAATQQQQEMSDIGVPGVLIAEQTGDTLESINRWFDKYENGEIPLDALVEVPGFGYARPDVGAALKKMKRAAAKDGVNLSGGGYRSFAEQAALFKQKPGLAAPAGRSNHGWGIAIDFSGADWNTPVFKWLSENAARFGLAHPSWAQQDGSRPEPWHWEYVGGGEVTGIYKKTRKLTTPPVKRKPEPDDLVSPESPLTGGNAFVAAVLSMATQEMGPSKKRVRETFQFDKTPETREEIVQAAKAMAAAYGWTGKKWRALRNVIEGRGDVPGESNWDPTALNEESGATGIPQLHPDYHEIPKNWKNPLVQIRWLLSYVANRYGDPLGAWAHKQEKGWY